MDDIAVSIDEDIFFIIVIYLIVAHRCPVTIYFYVKSIAGIGVVIDCIVFDDNGLSSSTDIDTSIVYITVNLAVRDGECAAAGKKLNPSAGIAVNLAVINRCP